MAQTDKRVTALAKWVDENVEHGGRCDAATTDSVYFEDIFGSGLKLRISDHMGAPAKDELLIIYNKDGSVVAANRTRLMTLANNEVRPFIKAAAFVTWTRIGKDVTDIIDALKEQLAKERSERDRSPLKGLTLPQIRDVTEYIEKKFKKGTADKKP